MNSDDEDVNVEEVKSESGFGNVVVVDNLPKVPSAKVEKLTTVLKKIFGQIGLIRENGLVMPVDDTGSTKGFAFVEFHGAAEAAAAREQTDGYKLDKAHVFKTSSFDDFAKFERVPDVYEQPKPKPWTPKENTQSYMLDERGRDQYAIRFGDATEIHWNDAQKSAPVEVYKRDFWTESYVQWSPRGNFLATVHRQGVALWGGPGFTRFQKFSHNGVQFIEFSPCERFLASGSTHDEGREATVLVSFFDTRSGAKLRSFQGPISEFAVGSGARGGLTWPVFKWGGPSPDGAFFARMKKDQISVYEAPTMTLVDKKSISLEGVIDFCWSPADPILSVFQPEQGGGNQPARVSLISLPSKKEIRSKNLFSVSDVKMYWQQSGDYFACKVDHHTKSKKSIYSGFELFRVKEPNCPMEVLELPDKNQKIVAFAWEPKGHRFAVIHGDGARPDVSFYTMIDKDSAINKVKLIGTLKNKTANHLFWSPQGGTIVLAGLKDHERPVRVLQRGRDGNHGERGALHGHGRGVGSHRAVRHHRRHERAPDGKRLPRLDVQRATFIQTRTRALLPVPVAPSSALAAGRGEGARDREEPQEVQQEVRGAGRRHPQRAGLAPRRREAGRFGRLEQVGRREKGGDGGARVRGQGGGADARAVPRLEARGGRGCRRGAGGGGGYHLGGGGTLRGGDDDVTSVTRALKRARG
jgi:translation initiation factor 3 subunit B